MTHLFYENRILIEVYDEVDGIFTNRNNGLVLNSDDWDIFLEDSMELGYKIRIVQSDSWLATTGAVLGKFF